MDESNQSKYLFAKALSKFLVEISGLSNSLPVIMKYLHEEMKNSTNEIAAFLNEKSVIQEKGGENDDEDQNITKYEIKLDYFYDFKRLVNSLIKVRASSVVIPKSFLVAMVSQFDAFIGDLMKAMYYTETKILNSSKKQLTFSELIRFETIDDIREYIIEKEVEDVLRESHSAHFDWLENKLGIPLRKGLDSWPTFIEITERRNLFVHTDGEISRSYIENCNKHGVQLKNSHQVGVRLGVNPEYYQSAYETLYEIATKLTYVMWRKLLPDELDAADTHLINITYELLKNEQYSLAKKILVFALNLPNHHSQQNKLIFTINLAIAYKWGGEPDMANSLITRIDWSASSLIFQLVSAVLLEKYDEAATIMRQIGTDRKVAYKDWPVFQDFRHTQQFSEAYSDIFEESLATIEINEGADITTESEYEKNVVLSNLENSRSFMQTHGIIEKLNKFSTFSIAQRNHIVATAVSNGQIYRIIKDQDVNDFMRKVITGYENKLDSVKLLQLQEML